VKNFKKIIYLIIPFLIFSNNLQGEIKDGLFATVGNKAITESDIVKEIKTILILSDQPYNAEKRDTLQSVAVRESVKRNIKKIEIEKYNNLSYNESDLSKELIFLAEQSNSDIDTLKLKFAQNGIDFSNVIENIKTELLWNSLIFQIYKDRLNINLSEVEEQLKSLSKKKDLNEYLISEIIIKPVTKDKLNSEINKIKEEIKIQGFEKIAMEKSISDSSINGGDLGWVNQNVISEEFESKIINTAIGQISEPVLLPEGIVFFKVRDKRVSKKNIDLVQARQQIINSEKTKILNMYSLSHYDTLRRTIAINYY
tara:strand:+ start:1997 stop:2932 length:936 start_codon:yes stop_codon:yes gene_type:complete